LESSEGDGKITLRWIVGKWVVRWKLDGPGVSSIELSDYATIVLIRLLWECGMYDNLVLDGNVIFWRRCCSVIRNSLIWSLLPSASLRNILLLNK
jgi:hypothetical protein